MRFVFVRQLLIPLILSAPTAAQVTATDQIVGWSTGTPFTTPAQIDMQDVDNSCRAASRVCSGILRGNTQFPSGGTAWDANRQAVWVSDGKTIAVHALPGCRLLCSFQAALLNSNAVVSGLAISDTKQRLFQLESTQGSLGIRSYDIRRCPPAPLNDGCTLKIQSNATAGGLAYDEVRDLLYFTESFPAFVGYITNLHIARAGNVCRPVCQIGMRSCGTGTQGWGAVSGLAYASCSNRLYATDGQVTSVTTMTDPLNCGITHVSCCARGSVGSYRGLAVVPGWKQRTAGKSCLPQSCACANMAARLSSEPSLGNPAFGFEVAGGPGGQFAFLVLGAGCGNGLPLPILCQPLFPLLVPPPILSPAVQLAGSGCNGAARIPFALPLLPGLCRLQLCAQWIVICGQALGATEAIEFTIAGT